MLNKIKLHIEKYIFYDLIFAFIMTLLIIFIIKFVKDYNLNKNYEYLVSNDFIAEVYHINPSLFKFNEENIAIIKMDDLIKPITNGIETTSLGIVPLDKNQNQCVGYIEVKKENDSFIVDSSHMCDMIDYWFSKNWTDNPIFY